MTDLNNLMAWFLESVPIERAKITALIREYDEACEVSACYTREGLQRLRSELSRATVESDKVTLTSQLHDMELVASNDVHPRQTADRASKRQKAFAVISEIHSLVSLGRAKGDEVRGQIVEGEKAFYAAYGLPADRTSIHQRIDFFERQLNSWQTQIELCGRLGFQSLPGFTSIFRPRVESTSGAVQEPVDITRVDPRLRRTALDVAQNIKEASDQAAKTSAHLERSNRKQVARQHKWLARKNPPNWSGPLPNSIAPALATQPETPRAAEPLQGGILAAQEEVND